MGSEGGPARSAVQSTYGGSVCRQTTNTGAAQPITAQHSTAQQPVSTPQVLSLPDGRDGSVVVNVQSIAKDTSARPTRYQNIKTPKGKSLSAHPRLKCQESKSNSHSLPEWGTADAEIKTPSVHV